MCGLITPWNFPMEMGTRGMAAALAVDCTVVVKSDELTLSSLDAIAVLGERAGIRWLNIVTALENNPQLSLALCRSDTARKISFSRSTGSGKLPMQQASSKPAAH